MVVVLDLTFTFLTISLSVGIQFDLCLLTLKLDIYDLLKELHLSVVFGPVE